MSDSRSSATPKLSDFNAEEIKSLALVFYAQSWPLPAAAHGLVVRASVILERLHAILESLPSEIGQITRPAGESAPAVTGGMESRAAASQEATSTGSSLARIEPPAAPASYARSVEESPGNGNTPTTLRAETSGKPGTEARQSLPSAAADTKHEELPLERLKTEAERWVAYVASNGSISYTAAHELRQLVQKAHDLGYSRQPAELAGTRSSAAVTPDVWFSDDCNDIPSSALTPVKDKPTAAGERTK